MQKSLISFLILLTTVLLSCETTPADKVVALGSGNFVRYTYFRNGKTSSEQHFIKDKNEKEFFAGDYNSYYESGKLKTHSTFTVVDSTVAKTVYNEYGTEYYENGFPKNDFSKFGDALAGMQVYYFPNGNINQIRYYTHGKVSFFLEYDKNKSIAKMQGFPLEMWSERKTIKQDRAMGMSYSVISTRDLRNTLQIKIVNPNGKQTYDTMFTNFRESRNQFRRSQTLTFKSIGKYVFNYHYELLDITTGHKLYNESFSDTINVIP